MKFICVCLLLTGLVACNDDGNNNENTRPISSIMVMEVSA